MLMTLLGLGLLMFVIGTAGAGILLVMHFLIHLPKFVLFLIVAGILIYAFLGLTFIPIIL